VGLPFTIVCVEDNQGDVLLLEQAFEQRGSAVTVQALPDWEAALSYLGRKESAREVPPPDLLLLDQQLPRGEGTSLMEFIATSDVLDRVPAYLYTSASEADRLRECFPTERVLETPDSWDRYLALVDRFIQDMRHFRHEPGIAEPVDVRCG
jgi:CheY-like chemotaxis protein